MASGLVGNRSCTVFCAYQRIVSPQVFTWAWLRRGPGLSCAAGRMGWPQSSLTIVSPFQLVPALWVFPESLVQPHTASPC